MDTNLRPIKFKALGNKHGAITRVVSPGDIGEDIKPFIFLDFINATIPDGFGFGYHPHSGIATLTYQLTVDVNYVDTEGKHGILKANGLEWMQAGGGAWHKGQMLKGGKISGFQLWVSLPEKIEDEPSFSKYIAPEEVPVTENIKILLGEYNGINSPIKTPSEMNYFDITLNQNEKKNIKIPNDHDVAWAFVYQGESLVNNEKTIQEIVVFENLGNCIELSANQNSKILFGSARKHPFPLVSGYYSVHTNSESLRKGEAKINEIGKMLKGEGKL
jgi:redox-sensitive bicupin YhaK (pirin superfamily)